MIEHDDGTFSLWVRGKEVRGSRARLTVRPEPKRGVPDVTHVWGRRFGPLSIHQADSWQWIVTHENTGLQLYASWNHRLAEDALRMLLGSRIRWSIIKTVEQARKPRMVKRVGRLLDSIRRRHIYLQVLLRWREYRRPRRGRRVRKRGKRRRRTTPEGILTPQNAGECNLALKKLH